MLSTPQKCFLWLGSKVNSDFKIGSLNILKAFAGKNRKVTF